MSNESWPTHGPDFNAWNSDFDKFSALLHSVKEEAWWVCDHGLKYLNIRIDTRDNGFLLLSDAEDGKRTRISPDRVIAAIEKHLDMFPTRRAALSVPAAAVVGEPIGYVSAPELVQLKTGVSCVDLFREPQPGGIDFAPVYAAPSAPDGRVATLEHLLGEVLHCHNDGTGLLDCMDNKGGRYTSKHLAETIKAIRAALGGASHE